MSNKYQLSVDKQPEILRTLKARFEKNTGRHEGMEWTRVEFILQSSPGKLWSLNEMEQTGGEPDIVGEDKKTNQVIFYDCSPESPKGRRSVCYDEKALESRKENKPKTSAIHFAEAMGIDILTEEEYRQLQKLGNFDAKTSSWLKTPGGVRELGGALFGDFRYGTVFLYHNAADSYYAARGFRGSLKI